MHSLGYVRCRYNRLRFVRLLHTHHSSAHCFQNHHNDFNNPPCFICLPSGFFYTSKTARQAQTSAPFSSAPSKHLKIAFTTPYVPRFSAISKNSRHHCMASHLLCLRSTKERYVRDMFLHTNKLHHTFTMGVCLAPAVPSLQIHCTSALLLSKSSKPCAQPLMSCFSVGAAATLQKSP